MCQNYNINCLKLMQQEKIIIDIKELRIKLSYNQTYIKLIAKQFQEGKSQEIIKFQTKKQIILKNNKAIIDQKFYFQHINHSKIVLIVLSVKRKQINLLGLINIDISKILKSYPNSVNMYLQKSVDPKAEINLIISKQNLNINKNLNSEKQKQGISPKDIKTLNSTAQKSIMNIQCQKQQRINQDKSVKQFKNDRSIIEISHRNYKNQQILRNYKKEQRNTPSYSKGKLEVKTNNSIKILSKRNQKIPVARKVTPQPIKPQLKVKNILKVNKKQDSTITSKYKKQSEKSIKKQGRKNINEQGEKMEKIRKLSMKLEQIQNGIREERGKKQSSYIDDQFEEMDFKQKELRRIKREKLRNMQAEFERIQIIDKDERIKYLEQQKIQNEKMINKLSELYQKNQQRRVKEIQQIREGFEQEIRKLRQKIKQMERQNAEIKLKKSQFRERQKQINQKLKFKQVIQKQLKQNLKQQKNTHQILLKQITQLKSILKQIQNHQSHQTIPQLQTQQSTSSLPLTQNTSHSKISIPSLKSYITQLQNQNQKLISKNLQYQSQLFNAKKKVAQFMNIALQNGKTQLLQKLEYNYALKKIKK